MTPGELAAAIDRAQQLTIERLYQACIDEAMAGPCVWGVSHKEVINNCVIVGGTPFGVCDRHVRPARDAGYKVTDKPKRSKVYLEIYQLAEIYPDDLGYRYRCRICGDSERWIDQDTALDQFAEHLKRKHKAHGGRHIKPKSTKSTVT